MARPSLGPRKRRTREHIIADQAVHHVEGFILDEGHTAQRVERDYGYDLYFTTYDEQGYIEPGVVRVQVKAARELQSVSVYYVWDVDIRDHNLWMVEEAPVILILYDASRRRANWLSIQHYFREHEGSRPKIGAKSVRVQVPMQQVLDRHAIAKMRELKRKPRLRLIGD